MGSAYIPHSLIKVFNKVRRHIRGSDWKSRTEAFLEWAEENPGEIYAIQEREAQSEVRRMVGGRGGSTSLAEDVPF